MFVILLRFSDNRDRAGDFMDGHNRWIDRGFADGVFLMVGSLHPKQGGAVVAAGADRADLERRVTEDPFVAEGVVSAEILEIAPARADDRLAFLLE